MDWRDQVHPAILVQIDETEAVLDYVEGKCEPLAKVLERYIPPGDLRDFTQKVIRGEFKRPKKRPVGSGRYNDSWFRRAELALRIYELRKAGTTREEALEQVAEESHRSVSTLRDYYREINRRVKLDLPPRPKKAPRSR